MYIKYTSENMKKIGTITFHSPYNYGSSLQAYALQETVKKICNQYCEYKIINLRTEKQKYMYEIDNEKSYINKLIKRVLLKDYKEKYKIKNQKFEDFINNKLNVTREYKTYEELEKENFDFDYYISGSDQLWNLRAFDFDWAYYLGFVNKGKKISYAASFGPKKLTFTEEEKIKIQKYINDYSNLSVREQGSYDTIYELNGKKAEINMDPTILLEKKEWEKLIPKENVVSGEYILYYSLGQDKENIELVEEISKKMKLPVITTRYSGRNELFTNFKRIYDVGPVEFLNLLSNAKLVLTTSFHGTIFSVILNTPFFSINADKDYRRLTLLKTMGLETRNINKNNMEEKLKNAFEINFENSNSKIKNEKEKSIEYLRKALEIGE